MGFFNKNTNKTAESETNPLNLMIADERACFEGALKQEKALKIALRNLGKQIETLNECRARCGLGPVQLEDLIYDNIGTTQWKLNLDHSILADERKSIHESLRPFAEA